MFTSKDIYTAKSYFSNFKNREFREYQEQAVEFIVNSEKKIAVLESPPGSGKSLIGMIAGKLHNDMTYIVHSKLLQEQIIEDFPEAQLLKGRANYPCGIDNTRQANNCPKNKCINTCAYKIQKQIVKSHNLRILNYAYFITETNFIGGFSGCNFIVLDEADMLDHLLTNFISLNITERDIGRLKLHAPRYKTTASHNSLPVWRKWAQEALECAKNEFRKLDRRIKSWGKDVYSEYHEVVMQDCKRFETLMYKLNLFLDHVDETWIYKNEKTRYGQRWNFSPLWITPEIAEEYFFKHCPGKIVMMSAIFPPMRVQAYLLGISLDDIDYLKLLSTFPVKNRRVYLQPAGDLSYKNFDSNVRNIVDKIQEIALMYHKSKGLIHCTSYKLRNKIFELIKTDIGRNGIYQRLITHNTEDRHLKLLMFKESSRPLIMVSPSMERGISLDDEQARFLIVAKCPYESLKDKKVSQRLYASGAIGKLWYRSVTIQNLIQSMYRGVRSKEDYCDIYLIDEQIKRLIFENLKLIPKFIRESIQ